MAHLQESHSSTVSILISNNVRMLAFTSTEAYNLQCLSISRYQILSSILMGQKDMECLLHIKKASNGLL